MNISLSSCLSLGEYAALVIAGVMDLESGLKLVAHRAKLMMELCHLERTSMLAVGANADTVKKLIQSDQKLQELAISCNNSQSDCVVGGQITQLGYLKEQLSSSLKVKSKMLEVPLAYHTEAMDPMLEELTKFARGIALATPRIAIVSNVFGRVVQAGESAFNPEYFALHCRKMVAFDDGIQDLLQTDIDAVTSRWIEFGPSSSLLPMVSSRFDKNSVELLPCLRKGVPPSATISQLLARLYVSTTGINWRKVFEGQSKPSLVELPGMPFFLKDFCAQYQLASNESGNQKIDNANEAPHAFHSRIIQRPSETNDQESIYETDIDILKDYIVGHIVCDHALCPASVYHEMALSAVKDYQVDDADSLIWSLSNVNYASPLLYIENSAVIVRTTVRPIDDSGSIYKFAISSYSDGSPIEQQTIHCEGHVKAKSRSTVSQKHTRLALVLDRKKESYKSQTSPQEVFFTKAMYEKTFTRVVAYSPLYQVVQSIRINKETDEAFAICQLEDSDMIENSAGATILMDALLHIAGFVTNLNIDNGNVGICKEVKSATLTQEVSLSGKSFEVHCSTLTMPDETAVVADAYAVDSNGILAIFKGMVFQEVKQTNIGHALQNTTNRVIESKPDSTQATPPHSTTSDLPSSASKDPSPRPNDPKAPNIIRKIISTTCGLEPAKLSDNTNLNALGFDSLMMAELESNLKSAVDVECNFTTLADCQTVGDVEQLCHVKKGDPDPKTTKEPVDSSGPSKTPNDRRSVTSIIADTCGADVHSISPEAELDKLGIDSLMTSELHSRLQAISESKTISSAEIAECQTVADIEKLVGAVYLAG